jgi:flagellar biosynthesis/type III secretory pathway protein FliH
MTTRGRKARWTLKAIRARAARYKSRTEFYRGSKNAYAAAHRHGWLDQLDLPTLVKGKTYSKSTSKWTLKAVQTEAAKYKSRSEFYRGSRGAYAAAHRNGWLNMIGLPLQRWTLKTVQVEAAKYRSRTEFRKGSNSAYKAAQKKGWLNQLDLSTFVRKKAYSRWPPEAIQAEAAKYGSRSAFREGSYDGYQAAYKKGLLDELFPK